MDLFFLSVTWFGSLFLLLPIVLVLAVRLLHSHRIADALLLLGGLGGASLLVHGLKRLIARPRPPVQELLVSMPSDFSFPSAHTAQITAVACACALVIGKDLPVRHTVLLWLGMGTLALLVGISRNYLRVHYISDVVAGALLGTAWVFFLRWLLTIFGSRG